MKVSFLVFVYANRVWHTISMRLRSKRNHINGNFCKIITEIVSENSGEIREECQLLDRIRNDSSSRVALAPLARSTDRPIARNRGSTFKNDCRQIHVGLAKCPMCIAWVRAKKRRTRNFDASTRNQSVIHDITISIGIQSTFMTRRLALRASEYFILSLKVVTSLRRIEFFYKIKLVLSI